MSTTDFRDLEHLHAIARCKRDRVRDEAYAHAVKSFPWTPEAGDREVERNAFIEGYLTYFYIRASEEPDYEAEGAW